MRARREVHEKNVRTGARLQDRLRRASSNEVFGRERELDALAAQLGASGAVVTFVYGIGGIGKTALLAASEPRLSAAGARVFALDGRVIEPTPRGFSKALSEALGLPDLKGPESIAAELERHRAPSVFLVDEYDHLRLIDDWLRHTLLPTLPERTRWIMAGRFAPRSAWLTTPGWSEAVLPLRLAGLGDAASRAVLASRGVAEGMMAPLLGLARGTPLALTLATSRTALGALASSVNESSVLATLAQRSVESLPQALREAVEASCVVRRVTRDLLEAMLGRPCDDQLLNELSELSFMEHTDDGLTLHESVRHALASRLSAMDPARHRQLRHAAWMALERMLAGSTPTGPHAWRLTSDLLFVVEHPMVREAFFPSSDGGVAMDVALTADRAALRAMVQHHDPDWMPIFEAWWTLAPRAFRVARGQAGEVLGFTLVAPAHELSPALSDTDPLLALWQANVARGPGRERGALFMRRTLSVARGEAANEVRAAIWLDIKRSYVERPAQWELYVATRQEQELLPLLSRLGFTRTELAHQDDRTLRLEFGAAGIWSWLRRLMSRPEVSDAEASRAPEPWSLDVATRGLWVDGSAVPLSALEYRALEYLLSRRGTVVTRNELLDAVWEQRHTGSNVVDAVVRLLRKKLGPHAGDLRTIRGHGYRLEPRT